MPGWPWKAAPKRDSLSRSLASLALSSASIRFRSVMSVISAWMICRPLHSIRVRVTSSESSSPSGALASQSNRVLPRAMHSSTCLRPATAELSPSGWNGGAISPGCLPKSSLAHFRRRIRTAAGLTSSNAFSSWRATPWLDSSNSARNFASDSFNARSARLRSVLSVMLARIRFCPCAGRRSSRTSVGISLPEG